MIEPKYNHPGAPIYLHFAMNMHFNSALAKSRLGVKHWNSRAGTAVREWLVENGLAFIVEDIACRETEHGGIEEVGLEDVYKLTDRGRAWVEYACHTPLPVEEVVQTKWVLP